VRAGDRVTFHEPVGIMGSTGRSTAEHLHYEIRIDGRPLDPANFLEAGRQMRHVLER
jgi:murein DD-endopeptidase MepM/ murein hydrolase activator NlpD